ncbi:MAG TPA: hypothetical protein VGM17_17745 [Rhizomicrobium sp.]|jgi:hypothetical protein
MSTTNSLQAFLQTLEAFAQTVKDKIAAFASDFLPQVESDAEIALEDLASLAMNAVLAQAGGVVSGREKFGNAVDTVVQQVEQSGQTVLQQTAQMAVQQAYLTAQSVVAANVK